MNITGCSVPHCPGGMHSTSCREVFGKDGNPEARSLQLTAGFQADRPQDIVTISDQARALFHRGAAGEQNRLLAPAPFGSEEIDGEELLHEEHAHDHTHDHEEDEGHDSLARQRAASRQELSAEELRQLRELQSRDRQVRNHEQAHIAASGRIATTGPQYEYEKGPDGRNYAVGGSVSYNMPPASSPAEELRLAQQLRRMALAPMDPSPKDRAVAAKASTKEVRAKQDIRAERAEEMSAEEDAPGMVASTRATVSDPGGDPSRTDLTGPVGAQEAQGAQAAQGVPEAQAAQGVPEAQAAQVTQGAPEAQRFPGQPSATPSAAPIQNEEGPALSPAPTPFIAPRHISAAGQVYPALFQQSTSGSLLSTRA